MSRCGRRCCRWGESRIELLEATAEDSVIGRFVEKRGEGLHHIAVRVADVDAMFARLTEQGCDWRAMRCEVGAGGHRYFFVHPVSTGGGAGGDCWWRHCMTRLLLIHTAVRKGTVALAEGCGGGGYGGAAGAVIFGAAGAGGPAVDGDGRPALVRVGCRGGGAWAGVVYGSPGGLERGEGIV